MTVSITVQKKSFTTVLSAAAMAFAAVLASAASGPSHAAGTHGGGHGGGHADTLPFGKPGKPSEVDRTVTVTMGDSFFAPETIVVRPGETVRFVLKNDGTFLHEFNIGTAAMHAAHQEEMMAMMESGMMTATGLNESTMQTDRGTAQKGVHAHDDPNSVLLEPGRQKTLIWTFAETDGLEFACNVPGHFQSGMKGTFRFGPDPRVGS